MNSQYENGYTIQGKPVPSTSINRMEETNLSEDLSSKLDRDGYLLLRNVYDPNEVIEARKKILWHLYEVGEVKDPYESGIFSGESNRRYFYPNTQKLG